MGQINGILPRKHGAKFPQSFTDLDNLPPELAMAVLSNLNATDLCLAACVWDHLANNNLLWMSLCRTTWKHVSAYKTMVKKKMTYKSLYLLLDDGTCLFNIYPKEGILFLVRHHVLEDNIKDLTLFIHGGTTLNPKAIRNYLEERRDILVELVNIQRYHGMFLPAALRKLFHMIEPPEQRGEYLDSLLELFTRRFLQCNPDCQLSQDTLIILCHSLILLSVDLSSPKVKTKMTKREFIKNLRGVTQECSVEYIGDMYDDIYLSGHIAVPKGKCSKPPAFPFERPYGKIFLAA
ncbi:predicted protein [Nematostella vectensis]|uniref:F-box only protein 8 n=1 Tax=Nematostella vectensis TaxID=45351 RepID=A7RN73_NEMVE|nr:predicted protein [Nematostella vectensis]|eukprot:XP_001639150.1 predicted protein [Nematostella vectensis]